MRVANRTWAETENWASGHAECASREVGRAWSTQSLKEYAIGHRSVLSQNLDPTFKPNSSLANERVGSVVQDLGLVLKGTTYLLTLKWVGVNSVLHPMSLVIHPVLPLKCEASWASAVELPSPIQI
ncbi:hypothetical protein E6C27_scaffold160G00510 [Cucumis melo var. makuwa]|uniref:Uncharacterized protein n=1 Tax=Cucumis melo var. makuwa TaxID=1194695 RepID=A0A5A7V2U4_CUCMM|nr:hypothetical protein E6C27_scaffold160G00510 [Cucumis melo var. makuwa]